MEEFELDERELSIDNSHVKLVYKVTFTRSPGKAIFEIVADPSGYWKIKQYLVWFDNWKQL